MAVNTVDIKGDKETLEQLINMTFQGEFYDDTIINVGLLFKAQPYLTKVTFPNAETFTVDGNLNGTFYDCPELVTAEFPKLKWFRTQAPADNTQDAKDVFRNCVKLRRVYVPLLTNIQYPQCFYGCASLVDDCGIPWENLTWIAGEAFRGCTSLVNISLPALTKLTLGAGYSNMKAFFGCTSLRRLYMPLLIDIYGNSTVGDCPSLEIYRMPSYAGSNSNGFVSESNSTSFMTNMKLIDLGETQQITQLSLRCGVRYTKILILRRTSAVTSLANASEVTAETTPSPIKVYVPSALIETYKTASNWSTLFTNNYVQFYALEGSAYESPTFDDTSIYNANRGDL